MKFMRKFNFLFIISIIMRFLRRISIIYGCYIDFLDRFDILLDKKCKPWLLEVNHTPSFKTDTPLDVKIKGNLIKDTLKLVNNSQGKLSGKNKRFSAYKNQEFKEIQRKIQRERDIFEEANIGNFERIHKGFEEKYEGFCEMAIKCWEDTTGTS